MEETFISKEEQEILKKLADSCQTYDTFNDLFKPVDEIITVIESEIKAIHFNCTKVFSIMDSTNDENCLSILANLDNVSNASEKISTLEKKLFLYNRLLTKIEIAIAAIEDKKIPQKRVGKVFVTIINSMFRKKNESESFTSLKSINMDEELDEISKIKLHNKEE